jgi:Protein of unknown function (DUF4236)
MPLRFRRTLRVGPGVKLNFSKSGVSTTVGPKGFHFTFGKRGVRRSIGIPGTGVSEVDYIKKNETEAEKEKEERREQRQESRVEEHRNEKDEQRSEGRTRSRRSRAAEREAAASASTGLRNAFILLGIVVFFFAGAAMLGLMPAHFVSNSLQFLTQLIRSTGH